MKKLKALLRERTMRNIKLVKIYQQAHLVNDKIKTFSVIFFTCFDVPMSFTVHVSAHHLLFTGGLPGVNQLNINEYILQNRSKWKTNSLLLCLSYWLGGKLTYNSKDWEDANR